MGLPVGQVVIVRRMATVGEISLWKTLQCRCPHKSQPSTKLGLRTRDFFGAPPKLFRYGLYMHGEVVIPSTKL